MIQYKELINQVLEHGKPRTTRNGHEVLSLFTHSSKYDLRKGFPMVTTKKVSFHNVYWELIWFLKGDTNIKFLLRKNVNIWNADAYREYCKHSIEGKMTQDEFVKRVKTDSWFAYQFGFLGNIYGKQWRSWKTRSDKSIDQITNVIESIKNNPNSRRHIVTAWNVADIEKMAVPPCHTLCQFYVQDDYLDCVLYQRSGDVFLGVPYNISSYSLLLTIVANLTGLKPRYFNHVIGDAHIYRDHLEQCKVQLGRECLPLPSLLSAPYKTLKELVKSDSKKHELKGYEYHGALKGKLLV
jgi:thymidylate synthase